MHITFVGFGWEQLGLAQLSAIARAQGHTVGLAFSAGLFDDRYNLSIPFLAGVFRDDDQVLREIVRQQPDVLAFSPLTSTYQWMMMIARRAKEVCPSVITVFGGVHVSAVPERVVSRPEVDILCVGEGDQAFDRILEMIRRRRREPQPNVWFRDAAGRVVRGGVSPFYQDLDALPMFDKTLWEDVISFKEMYFTMASRGCPYRCSYCFNDYAARQGSGRYVRFRGADHVLKELLRAKQRYRPRLIEFEDDVFTLNRDWLKTLMQRYRREIGIPFQCLTHPGQMDDEIARILKEGGCRYVQMGIQSLDDDYKRTVLKRPETSQQVEQALQSMRRAGLAVKIDHMFALPGESPTAQEAALEIYRRYPPYRMQTFWMNYLPGTSIIQHARRLGIVSDDRCHAIEEGLVADDYRNSAKFDDPGLRHQYRAYECVFRLLTVLPQSLRRSVSLGAVYWMPGWLLSMTSFTMDLVSGLIKRNPDHWAYAGHYLRHMRRILSEKVKGKMRSRMAGRSSLERIYTRSRLRY